MGPVQYLRNEAREFVRRIQRYKFVPKATLQHKFLRQKRATKEHRQGK